MRRSDKIIKWATSSIAETIQAGESLARQLKPGDVIALTGDLGSGKTTFIKGVAKGLGLKNTDEVKSPTFVIMHVYSSRIPLYHFDLYRLEEAKDLAAIGFDEFLADQNAVCCIEWAEKATDVLPANTRFIELRRTGETSREIVETVSRDIVRS